MSTTNEPLRISAADGYALGATLWGSEATGPIVILNGATGVRARYYGPFAQYLAGRGFTVITWDYRGIGQSKPGRLRGFAGRLRDWGALDFEGVLHHCERHLGDRPMLAMGHSVGGQLLGMAPSNGVLKGAITVGSQSGWWGHWQGLSRWRMAGVWFAVMPAVTTALGYLPGVLGVGADLPREVALEWARWGRSRDFFLSHGVSKDGFERIRAPLHAYSFTDDDYAPAAAVDWLHALYANAGLVRHHLTPRDIGAQRVGHFAPFHPAFRSTLWSTWAESFERMAAPTSPATQAISQFQTSK